MPSFDIVCKTDVHEVDNALANVTREIGQRFDFKGSKSKITREGNEITVLADDELKLKQLHELLRGHLARRHVPAEAVSFKKPEAAAGNMVRQTGTIAQGIPQELGKKIAKEIKSSKLKVQVAIQGDALRVSGKKKDDLQDAIALVKDMKTDQPLQYDNFRD